MRDAAVDFADERLVNFRRYVITMRILLLL